MACTHDDHRDFVRVVGLVCEAGFAAPGSRGHRPIGFLLWACSIEAIADVCTNHRFNL
jgi:hypothetical protein